jgi:H+/Cl- antiporter ClcA
MIETGITLRSHFTLSSASSVLVFSVVRPTNSPGSLISLPTFQGLYGAFVMKFNLQVAAFRRKHLGAHGIYEAVFLAVLTALIGYLNRFLRMDMTESLEVLFRECEGGGNYFGLCQ